MQHKLRKSRININAYEEAGKFSNDKIVEKYKRFKEVRTVAAYEEELAKGMEPVFLKVDVEEEKDDKGCSFLKPLEPY